MKTTHELCNEWFKGNRWYGFDNSTEVCAPTKAAVLRQLGEAEDFFEHDGILYKTEDAITFKLTGSHPYGYQTVIQTSNIKDDLNVGDLILIGKLLKHCQYLDGVK